MRSFGRSRLNNESSIKVYLKETDWKAWNGLICLKVGCNWRYLVKTVLNLRVKKRFGEILSVAKEEQPPETCSTWSWVSTTCCYLWALLLSVLKHNFVEAFGSEVYLHIFLASTVDSVEWLDAGPSWFISWGNIFIGQETESAPGPIWTLQPLVYLLVHCSGYTPQLQLC